MTERFQYTELEDGGQLLSVERAEGVDNCRPSVGLLAAYHRYCNIILMQNYEGFVLD